MNQHISGFLVRMASQTHTCADDSVDCSPSAWLLLAFPSFAAENECHLERTDGCQHFCHPGQSSYVCSCAKGYKLGKDHKSCSPSGEFSQR